MLTTDVFTPYYYHSKQYNTRGRKEVSAGEYAEILNDHPFYLRGYGGTSSPDTAVHNNLSGEIRKAQNVNTGGVYKQTVYSRTW